MITLYILLSLIAYAGVVLFIAGIAGANQDKEY